MRDASACQASHEAFSAVAVSAEGNSEPAAHHRSGDAEKARDAGDEVRQLVYRCFDTDRDGWRRWRGSFDKELYPRVWLGRERGGFVPSYRLIYTWEQGPIPPRWTIDHACGEKDCLDHHPGVRAAGRTVRVNSLRAPKGRVCSMQMAASTICRSAPLNQRTRSARRAPCSHSDSRGEISALAQEACRKGGSGRAGSGRPVRR
jgi:hypothetical protein